MSDLRERLIARAESYERLARMEDNEYPEPDAFCDARGGDASRLTAQLLREAASTINPGFDPSNHHNALACPYCNPNNLTLAAQSPIDSMRAIQQHQRGEVK